MKIDDITALLSEISDWNNLGAIAFREGTMNHRRDGSCLIAFDRAIADFSKAVSAVRAGLHSIRSGGSDHDNNSIYNSSGSSTSAHAATKKRKQASRCATCSPPSVGRTTMANRFSATSVPKHNPQQDVTRTKALVQRPTPQSLPPIMEDEASNQSLGSPRLFEQGLQHEASRRHSLVDLRNAILNDVDKSNDAYLPRQSMHSEEVAFVYHGSITIDPLDLRKWLEHVVTRTRLLGKEDINTDPSKVETTGCVDCLLRDFLFRMSVIIVYNLGLAHHLKSIRERAEFPQSFPSTAPPLLDSSHSTTFVTSLQKAQGFYSIASRHITQLPSWKFKLALLNNLGHVYWERNLGDNSRKCFEVVCRHIIKVVYQCSHRSLLIPSFPPFVNGGGALYHIPNEQGTEELLQTFMIAALMKLLAKPHAAVA